MDLTPEETKTLKTIVDKLATEPPPPKLARVDLLKRVHAFMLYYMPEHGCEVHGLRSEEADAIVEWATDVRSFLESFQSPKYYRAKELLERLRL